MGSPDLYYGRGTGASLNFIACHDGFTLADMVAYGDKHNEANGENNQDGANDNNSWNCGVEGATNDPAITQLRRQQIKNAIAMLMVSQGVPMILSGDEVGHTQRGNNNAYCHDTELGWFDWTALDKNADLFQFVRNLVAFRHAQPVLRSQWHLTGRDYLGGGYADVSWHGTNAWDADWSSGSRVLAFLLAGNHARGGSEPGDDVYVAMNMHWQGLDFHLPQAPNGRSWHVVANTGATSPCDSFSPGSEPRLEDQGRVPLSAHSTLILVSKG
jgi:glycogen operon protein